MKSSGVVSVIIMNITIKNRIENKVIAMHNLNIQHDMINRLFFTKVKGGMAKLSYHKTDDQHLVIDDIHVPESSKGMGVAPHLVESALEFAKERSLIFEPGAITK